jgi:hypothetical protein
MRTVWALKVEFLLPTVGGRSRLEPMKIDRREVFKVQNMAGYSIEKLTIARNQSGSYGNR